ncbi:hypothetical protein CYMTET_25067 [Cymbomonas tetramitiformis]|uniref:Uncharacterized protein n=1 Tax=Cymbomonas tetramitiformis TaxID=36881 RepID=A0AAE0BNP1_9CHLO|nr:hypothetical protein CYMTET_50697 [Cymbomonas tetramitiformis]KAK3266302.1 hypothetical protein CYMTET_25067 [Cymbomonas tetramitiformis]
MALRAAAGSPAPAATEVNVVADAEPARIAVEPLDTAGSDSPEGGGGEAVQPLVGGTPAVGLEARCGCMC